MRESEKGYAKEAWKNLTFRQKLTQFKDYYLVYVVVGAIILAVLAGIIKTVFFTHETSILSVAVFNDMIDETTRKEFESSIREMLDDHDRNHTILIKDGYDFDNYQDAMVFQVLVAGESTDLVAADRETFAHYAASGFFLELQDYLSSDEIALLGDRVFETPGEALSESGESLLSDPDAVGETAPYGIELASDSIWYQYSLTKPEDVVIGIIANTKNPENSSIFVKNMIGLT